MNKTVIFESKYKTSISNFSTTQEVDEFLEGKLGRKLEVFDRVVIPVKKIEIPKKLR